MNRHVQDSITTRRNTRVFERFTTTNATPAVFASIPLGENKASYFQVKGFCVQSDFTKQQVFDAQVGFRRAVGGNITRSTPTNGSAALVSVGDFAGPVPTIALVANTSTQSIDITITGKAGVTLYWQLEALSIQNLT